eukprot:482509_1
MSKPSRPEAMDEDTDIQMAIEASTTTDHVVTNSNTNPVDEEKKSGIENINHTTNFGLNPLQLVQSAMSDFLQEMNNADQKATSLYQEHLDKQQRLMNQFVADSLRLMHDFNTSLDPIHIVLRKLKQPVQDVLLNQFIAIPCDSLDEFTKQQRKTMYNKTWGISPLTYQYNQKHQMHDNPHLQCIDLGPEINSLKSTIQPQANNNNNEDTAFNEKELLVTAVLDWLSNTNNISASQTDLVLKFFNTARAEQKRIENKQQQKFKKIQQQEQQKAQREGGAAMLLSVFPWLTTEQAMTVMEIKSDNIEQATDYAMNTDPTDLCLAINEWRRAHPVVINDADGDSMMDNNNNNNNVMRSTMDRRVMNRSRTTGETKCVIFRCTAVSDDGLVTLQSVLDRNNIPLDPVSAKLLHLSITDLMNCEGIRIEASERIQIAQTERVLSIVFQVVKEEANEMELMQELMNSSWRNHKKRAEFVPIQFEPSECRDLEYELDFEDKTPLGNACLKSVKHILDGPVLFRGIYDDGAGLGLIGLSVNHPIDIYTQIIDEVTHNIVCIIFENDLRDNVVIDVKNISFTEQTLHDVIRDSANDFNKTDAAGNKISYRIIVKGMKIIGVLTKFGAEIKEMPYIEHCWLKEGELVQIASRGMLGLVKCIPTGLIVTNDPHRNIHKKAIRYTKNVNSRILRKHCADLDGFIDVDVVRENNKWRESDDPLCQSFAVTDIAQCSDDDIAQFIAYKQQNHNNITDELKEAMQDVENDFMAIKIRKDEENQNDDDQQISAKDLLNRATNTIKKIQELLSAFEKRKSGQTNDEETAFTKQVHDNINRYNREIRALRFE